MRFLANTIVDDDLERFDGQFNASLDFFQDKGYELHDYKIVATNDRLIAVIIYKKPDQYKEE